MFRCCIAASIVTLGFFLCSGAEASLPGKSGPLLITSQSGDPELPPGVMSDIYRVWPDGTFRESPMEMRNYSPAISPFGADLAFVRNPGDQLWIGDLDRLDASKQVTFDTDVSPTPVETPVFHPNGKSVIYARFVGGFPGPSLWQIARYWPRTGISRFSPEFGGGHPLPDVSPNGRLFSYSVGSDLSARIRLTRRLDDTGWLLQAPTPAQAPSFSPNGGLLAYLGLVNGLWQVFVSRVDGSESRQITSEPTSVWRVAFSPDGTKLAYQRDRVESAEIFVIDLRDGTRRSVATPGKNVVLNSWVRERVFKVVRYRPNLRSITFRFYGKGRVKVRIGRSVAAKRAVGRQGNLTVRLRQTPRRGSKVRVTFYPRGALPRTYVLSPR